MSNGDNDSSGITRGWGALRLFGEQKSRVPTWEDLDKLSMTDPLIAAAFRAIRGGMSGEQALIAIVLEFHKLVEAQDRLILSQRLLQPAVFHFTCKDCPVDKTLKPQPSLAEVEERSEIDVDKLSKTT